MNHTTQEAFDDLQAALCRLRAVVEEKEQAAKQDHCERHERRKMIKDYPVRRPAFKIDTVYVPWIDSESQKWTVKWVMRDGMTNRTYTKAFDSKDEAIEFYLDQQEARRASQ